MGLSRSVSKDDVVAEKAEFSSIHADEGTRSMDEQIQLLAREAPPFYQNASLRNLYLLMIPACLVPAITLGFDSAMMNGLQAVATWQECK